MCSCDEGQSIYWESWPKARKTHTCCECGSQIDPGEEYYRLSGIWDGKFSRFKMCLICKDVFSEAEAEFGCICLGQLWETVGVEFEYAACSG